MLEMCGRKHSPFVLLAALLLAATLMTCALTDITGLPLRKNSVVKFECVRQVYWFFGIPIIWVQCSVIILTWAPLSNNAGQKR